MSETSEQNWKKVDVDTLPDKVMQVFEWSDKESVEEFHEFYENEKNQHIQISLDEGTLFDTSIAEYIDKYNVGDSQNTPLLVDFFKPFLEKPNKISDLFEESCQTLGFDKISSEADIIHMSEWAVNQTETMMRPIYYEEKAYAQLVIILGELLLRNKLSDYFWIVEKTRLDFFDDRTDIEFSYLPYLSNQDGIMLDITQAFREYLFYETGNVKNVFTNIYNNIEKFRVKNNQAGIGMIVK